MIHVRRSVVLQIAICWVAQWPNVLYSQDHLDVQGNASIVGYLNVHKSDDTTSMYIGNNAGISNSRTAGNNVMIGTDAGRSGNPANSSFFGYHAGRVSTASNNAFFGTDAGRKNGSGGDNAFFGTYSGEGNLTGEKNAFYGFESGVLSTSGSQNSFFGEFAGGANRKGSYNTFIGSNAGVPSSLDSITKAIALGYSAKVKCHNCAVIGGIGANAVKVGIGTEEPQGYLEIVGNSGSIPHLLLKESEDDYTRMRFSNATQPNTYWDIAGLATKSGAQLDAELNFFYNDFGNVLKLFGNGDATLSGDLIQNSDSRLKENLDELSGMLPRILALTGYSFLWVAQPGKGRQIGLIAQEVLEQFPELVHEDSDGILSVNYTKFVPVLLEGMKEQQRSIQQQDIQIRELKSLVEKLMKLVNYDADSVERQ